jgi:hypothetical protein
LGSLFFTKSPTFIYDSYWVCVQIKSYDALLKDGPIVKNVCLKFKTSIRPAQINPSVMYF